MSKFSTNILGTVFSQNKSVDITQLNMFIGRFWYQDRFWTMVPLLINGTITYIESLYFYGNCFESNVRASDRNTHLTRLKLI